MSRCLRLGVEKCDSSPGCHARGRVGLGRFPCEPAGARTCAYWDESIRKGDGGGGLGGAGGAGCRRSSRRGAIATWATFAPAGSLSPPGLRQGEPGVPEGSEDEPGRRLAAAGLRELSGKKRVSTAAKGSMRRIAEEGRQQLRQDLALAAQLRRQVVPRLGPSSSGSNPCIRKDRSSSAGSALVLFHFFQGQRIPAVPLFQRVLTLNANYPNAAEGLRLSLTPPEPKGKQ